jgi:hypothetical protein
MLFGKKENEEKSGLNALEMRKKKFERYVDPTGELTSSELKYSLWFTKNRVLLYRILLWFLISFCILTWGFSILWWGNYLVFGKKIDQSVFNQLSNFVNLTINNNNSQPVPLAVLGAYVVPGGVNVYDLVAEVTNGNTRFLASFDYYFVVDGEKTETHHATFLPGETKLVGHFGLKSTNSPGSPVLVFDKISWQRISNQTINDPVAWQNEHLNFAVENFEFVRTESTEGASAHIIKFNLVNNSPYGYSSPQFYAGLFLQGSLVGIFPLTVQDFKSLEKRPIDLRSFVTTLQANEVKIFPLINIYDPAVYIRPSR